MDRVALIRFLAICAIICFVLAAFSVPIPLVQIGWVGLIFLAGVAAAR